MSSLGVLKTFHHFWWVLTAFSLVLTSYTFFVLFFYYFDIGPDGLKIIVIWFNIAMDYTNVVVVRFESEVKQLILELLTSLFNV